MRGLTDRGNTPLRSPSSVQKGVAWIYGADRPARPRILTMDLRWLYFKCTHIKNTTSAIIQYRNKKAYRNASRQHRDMSPFYSKPAFIYIVLQGI